MGSGSQYFLDLSSKSKVLHMSFIYIIITDQIIPQRNATRNLNIKPAISDQHRVCDVILCQEFPILFPHSLGAKAI